MSVLEQEIIEMFAQLDEDAKERIRNYLRQYDYAKKLSEQGSHEESQEHTDVLTIEAGTETSG